MKVIIVGGGGTGCLAALLLARAGHEVTVLEQDNLRPAANLEDAAASAFRASAPHIVQPHIIMARSRELLAEQLPDVYDSLLRAGVVEAPLRAQMPPSLPDKSPMPGDERLTHLLTRRSTVDWVLLNAVAAQDRVTFTPDTRVTGLIAAEPSGTTAAGRTGPPHVTGVRTTDGDLTADLVVDASGRRSAIDTWLAGIGARKPVTQGAECGLAYYSRHYRLRDGADLDAVGSPLRRTVAAFDEFLAGIWPGDNGSFQLAIGPLAADRRFRTLKDPAVFTDALRAIPLLAGWLTVLDPLTGVFAMGGLNNTFRRLVVDGAPVATGLHAAGDTVCTTNPTLGRGLTLALTGAADLVTVLASHGDDPYSQALELDRLTAAHVVPFYQEQAAVDAAQLAQMRHVVFGDPAPPAAAGTGDEEAVSFGQMRAAMPFDPVVFRGFWRVVGLIATPREVYTDPDIVTRTRRVLKARGAGPPVAKPSPERLLAALRA